MASRNGDLYLRSVGIAAGLLLIVYGVSAWVSGPPAAGMPMATSVEAPKARYTEFAHSVKAHRLECSNCHKFPSKNWKTVRPAKDAFPDATEYPQHESCLKCHAQQFFKGAKPNICSICHTDPGPRGDARHPFPNPREIFDLSAKGKAHTSDLVVTFPHDKHIEIVSGHSSPAGQFITASFTSKRMTAAEESCAVCHQTMAPLGKSPDEYLTKPPEKLGDAFWIKKGTFKSAPIGHTACFTCHSTDTGILPAPATCSACHSLKPPVPKADLDRTFPAKMGLTDKPMIDNWRRRYSSGTFAHEHFAHVDLACATCHTVAKLNTADPFTKKVPISSCATCHATPTLNDGGILNYEVEQRKRSPSFQCAKCHIAFARQPIPPSHLDALKTAAVTK